MEKRDAFIRLKSWKWNNSERQLNPFQVFGQARKALPDNRVCLGHKTVTARLCSFASHMIAAWP